MLMLGGDAHYNRQLLMRRLHAAGVLDRAHWSLSTPKECAASRLAASAAHAAAWRHFCRAFPKFLDIALEGELDGSPKDVSFPPRSLYARTSFSVVFESVVSAAGDEPCYTGFLTEKALKPIVRGHPFVLLCAAADAWAWLRAFGFRSFAPTVPEALTDTTYEAVPCEAATADGAYATNFTAELKRLVDLGEPEWAAARVAAAHNARHAVCPNGFDAVLRNTARKVLAFSVRVSKGRVGRSSSQPVE